MNVQKAIEEVIKYNRQAAVHRQLADELDYKAGKVLQEVSTSRTTKPKTPEDLEFDKKLAKIIARQESKIKTVRR